MSQMLAFVGSCFLGVPNFSREHPTRHTHIQFIHITATVNLLFCHCQPSMGTQLLLGPRQREIANEPPPAHRRSLEVSGGIVWWTRQGVVPSEDSLHSRPGGNKHQAHFPEVGETQASEAAGRCARHWEDAGEGLPHVKKGKRGCLAGPREQGWAWRAQASKQARASRRTWVSTRVVEQHDEMPLQGEWTEERAGQGERRCPGAALWKPPQGSGQGK